MCVSVNDVICNHSPLASEEVVRLMSHSEYVLKSYFEITEGDYGFFIRCL